ncbi:MAG: hypothetical protein R3308_10860, partial [Thiohalobacterales bacterium]|nr:hypothetical protein [Thiohalobacterales bacterium]
MTNRRSTRTRLLHGLWWLLLCTGVSADYKENIGYNRLVTEQGVATPDGTGIPVSLIEASSAGVENPPAYLPNANDPEFAGKSIVDMSAARTGLVSGHATSVAKRFFGNTTAIAPGIDTIHAFWADGWLLQDDFLRAGSGF